MKNIQLLIFLLFVSLSCRQDFDDGLIKEELVPGPIVLVESTIYGRVVNYSDEPINNAKLFIGNQSVFSDENGIFVLPNTISAEKLGVMDAFHSDYLPTHSIINAFVGDSISCYIRMELSEDLAEFDYTKPIKEIVSGSLSLNTKMAEFTYDGEDYTKTVHLKGASSDNKTKPLINDHMIGRHEMKDVMLDPIGQFEIYWMDDRKFDEVVLNEMIPAQWEIQKVLLNGAPAEIFVWHYNRILKRWEDVGKATKNGTTYLFDVKENGKYCLSNFAEMKFVSGSIKNHAELFLPNLDLRFEYGQLNNYQQLKTSENGKFLVFLPVEEQINMVVKSQCNDEIDNVDLGSLNANLVWNESYKLKDETSAFGLQGTLLDCDNNGLQDGYVLIESDKWNTQVLLPSQKGQYQTILESCDNENIEIQGFSIGENTSGIPMSFQLNSDVENGVVKSCKPIWESKFVVYDGKEHYNYHNCRLDISDSGNGIVSSYQFQSMNKQQEIVEHVIQQRNNATIGDFWTAKISTENGSRWVVEELLSKPFVREIQDANQNWWIEMEINNVVLYDKEKKTTLKRCRLYYFAKKDF